MNAMVSELSGIFSPQNNFNCLKKNLQNLSNVHLNPNLMLCDDPNCNDQGHHAAIDRMYAEFVDDALLTSGEDFHKVSRQDSHQVQGWNTYCK